MDKAEINTPDEDVDIGYEFSGYIRCRHLTILEGGSVEGTAVAHRIDVKGEFHGVADCEYFQALPPGIVRGTVFAPNYFTRDKDGRHSDAVVLHSTRRQAIFSVPSQAERGISLDEVINGAIDGAVSSRLSAGNPDASTPPGAAPPQTLEAAASADGIEMSLSERLASRGLVPLVPAMPDPPPAAPVDCEPRHPIQTARMPLPSLV